MSGEPAACSIHEAQAQLGDSVRVYLDAGACSGPVPSTVVDLSGETPRILREGRISREELATVVPALAAKPEPAVAPEAANAMEG